MLKIKTLSLIFLLFLIPQSFLSPLIYAKTISSKKAEVYQLRIYQDSNPQGIKKGFWDISMNYIGPGDIKNLLSLEIFLDQEYRVEAVKIVRKTYDGKIISSILKDISEISIETIPPGSPIKGKEVEILVKTLDELNMP